VDDSSYELTLVTGPTVEPVTLALAKKNCRVDYSDEDSLFAIWIPAARKLLEELTETRFVNQTWRLALEDWPDEAIEIPIEPVSSVSSVKYYAMDGTLTTMTAGTHYLTWLNHKPPLVYPPSLSTWPTLYLDRKDRIQVEFVAGMGADAAAVSEIAKAAILQVIGYWAENRGDEDAPEKFGLPPGAIRLIRHLGVGGYR
jgi:uncharacterized phiE125 gp8 family phage protein